MLSCNVNECKPLRQGWVDRGGAGGGERRRRDGDGPGGGGGDGGRGLPSFPFPLNLRSCCPVPLNLSPI